MRKVLILLLISVQVYSQHTDGEIELAGFVLGQHRQTVHAQLGAPIQVSRQKDGWVYEFHKFTPDTSVYGLFKYSPSDTNRIYGIEMVGKRYEEMHPFRGIRLGATQDKVFAALGQHDRTEKIEDPPLTTQFYKHKNYSVDIDSKGHLYGIQIFGNIMNNTPTHDPSIKGFKNAILTKNIDSLITWLAPDVEILKGEKVLRYSHGARVELNNPNSEFTKSLFAETQSVWYAFAKEYAEGTSETRLHPQLNQITSVDKFFDSNVISEIVFRTHAGKWKVYEIRFR
jgi:hypothetical protein